MPTLGERIRKFRKQQKMTLEALAGTELTKGMLSLIENNKANPSMESLNYIADRLSVDVTELLEEISVQELREVLDKAELLFNTKYDDFTDEHRQVVDLIEPYVPKLTQGYEAARLLEIYGRCVESEDILKQVAIMYDQLHLIAKRAEIGTLFAIMPFTKHNYQEALDILLAERAQLEMNPLWIDPLSRLDYDYYEAIFYFAVGKYENAIRVMENALQYSKTKKIFYRIDNLYRLAAAHAMMNDNVEKKDYYLQKLTAYSVFSDDNDSRVFTFFANIHYLNSFEQKYKEAEALLKTFIEKEKVTKLFIPFFNLEKGKTLYGLSQFGEAIEILHEVVFPDVLHHPIDLSIFYEKDAYLALCYLAQDQKEKALESITTAVENINPMPDTPYKTFIHKVHEKVKRA